MAEESSSKSPLSILGGNVKYPNWEKNMFGRLMYLNVIGIVEGTEVPIPKPLPTTVGNVTTEPKLELVTAYNAYQARYYKAAGEIYQWLDEGNKIHVDDIRTDAKAMWEKLRDIHSKSAPNSRINSLSDLMSIRLKDDEQLTDLAARVQGAMQKIRGLRPKDYDLKNLDEELITMSMIKALPFEIYGSFISSVLLLSDLSKDAVLEAFRTEETQRKGAIADIESANAAAARLIKCYICDGDHPILLCPQYPAARALAKKGPNSGNADKKKRGGRGANRGGTTANKAAESKPKVEEGCDGPEIKAEAAVCLPAHSTPDTGLIIHHLPVIIAGR